MKHKFGGQRGLYWQLSGYDNPVYFANLHHVPPNVQKRRIPELLEPVGLGGRGDEKLAEIRPPEQNVGPDSGVWRGAGYQSGEGKR